ncbi:MAG: transposase [Burkholderiales bacterium]|jgi:transposase|nr:MAG: transposase [Burkholderiales bacterium]
MEMVHTMKSEQDAGKASRRHHDRAFKHELVQQSLEPGASVSAIALHGGVNANMLFKWRREHLRAAGGASAAVLLPVTVAPAAEVMTVPASGEHAVAPPRSALRSGVIELEFAGAQLRLRGPVDEDSLRRVLRALRQSE